MNNLLSIIYSPVLSLFRAWDFAGASWVVEVAVSVQETEMFGSTAWICLTIEMGQSTRDQNQSKTWTSLVLGMPTLCIWGICSPPQQNRSLWHRSINSYQHARSVLIPMTSIHLCPSDFPYDSITNIILEPFILATPKHSFSLKKVLAFLWGVAYNLEINFGWGLRLTKEEWEWHFARDELSSFISVITVNTWDF